MTSNTSTSAVCRNPSRCDRPQKSGRRGVYLSEFQPRSEREPIRRFMRWQKWDVWEHLDEGKDLLQAIKDSDDYTDYWLDRRLGCRQLGMNLTRRVVMRRLGELYQGRNKRYRNERIRTTYFEREYLPGLATDKLPVEKYSQPGYAAKLARLLGQAAAAGITVGRALEAGPVFDDGDELVREGEDGLPAEILVGDHSGAFTEYQSPLETFAAHYARPVNLRDKVVPNLAGIRHSLPGGLWRPVAAHPAGLPQTPARFRHPVQTLQIRHRRQLCLSLGTGAPAARPNRRGRARRRRS